MQNCFHFKAAQFSSCANPNVALSLSSAVAELQRIFPTPPSLEQHPAFSPIMTYRDTPSQEPPAHLTGLEHPLNTLNNSQLSDFKMDMEDGMTSPKSEYVRVGN